MAEHNKTIKIDAKLVKNGIELIHDGKRHTIEYPTEVWKQVPSDIKEILRDNLAYGNTIYFPVILKKDSITYKTRRPLFESMLYMQHLFDMRDCERTDAVPALSYLRSFYNVMVDFAPGDSVIPDFAEIPRFTSKKDSAVIPFSFGKESLLTFSLSKELGMEPIPMVSQEPTQKFEEEYKHPLFLRFVKNLKIDGYYIPYSPGIYRHGVGFHDKISTELGWGGQTVMLTLTAIPLVYRHQARFILYGSEHSNNDWELVDGWKIYCSYDQTTGSTGEQSTMVRLLTNNQTSLHSILDPLEEISVFYMLHHRFPELGRYQFSCTAFSPLVKNSQWCHTCDKCDRNYVFALATGIDPASIGFKSNILLDKTRFQYYFDENNEFDLDLDIAFHVLSRRGIKSPHVERFNRIIKKRIKSYDWYLKFFTNLKQATNLLPSKYKKQLNIIFKQEMKIFKKALGN